LPTPPQGDIVLGMLAPAIPGRNTFKDINKTVPVNQTKFYNSIIVGCNKHDFATSKVIRFFSRHFGSTSLGCDPSEIKHTEATLHELTPDIHFSATNFSKDKEGRKHAIQSYMQCSHFDEFLKAVFITPSKNGFSLKQ